MRFGVFLPTLGPLASGRGVIEVARRCEALGYDAVWVGDHLAYPTQYIPRFGPVFYEALTTLAALGPTRWTPRAATTRMATWSSRCLSTATSAK